ncbi:apoptosis-enhancing nuclease isoform X2 [Oxyura jamaicensis]|uniref:apoptosis-enhancing nuclease isoform X2 n=1 Tax=Oxyura jamaicensis TaxID=8884 RepID=UPI0015A5D4EF|nr:apoptosis-enhancing nuclease isoform X2 [Oxyura jamaicensis]
MSYSWDILQPEHLMYGTPRSQGMPPGKGQMAPLLPPRAPPPAPKGAQAPPGPPQPRSKKQSRRHQRFLERRALLEQRGVLRPPRGQPGSQDPPEGLSKAPPRCGKVPKSPIPNGTAKDVSGADTAARVPLLRPTKYVAIDCEMVGTGPRGRQSELARCSVVGYHGDVIYDKYVRPQLPVVDYRTRWSGVTQRHLRNAIPFRVAQAEILKILKDKIVVGHAIHNDFQALKYFHPKDRTRDTSQIPLLNRKAGLPLRASASLKSLAEHLLHKKIQVGCRGHSSVEDAQTAMELYRLVEVQWETELARSQPPRPPSPPADPSTDSDQYLDDQYWPTDLTTGSL